MYVLYSYTGWNAAAYIMGEVKQPERTSPGGVPLRALLLQTSIIVGLLLTGTFETVLMYAFFAILSCSFLTVLGVIVLRFRQPQLPRPFRCWGYPVTPLIFLTLNGFTLIATAWEQPWQAAAGIATLGAGIGLYYFAKHRTVPA